MKRCGYQKLVSKIINQKIHNTVNSTGVIKEKQKETNNSEAISIDTHSIYFKSNKINLSELLSKSKFSGVNSQNNIKSQLKYAEINDKLARNSFHFNGDNQVLKRANLFNINNIDNLQSISGNSTTGNPKTSHDHYSKNVQLLNKLSLNKNISECAQNTMTYSKRVGTVTHFGVNDNQQQQCFFKSSNKIFKTVKTDQLLRDKVNRKLNISPLTNK